MRTEIISYINNLLEVQKFVDYCPNGLQVEGKPVIKTIVTGVTACQALLDKAVLLKADMVLVHHGYFWKGEAAEITGMKKNRLKTLLQHDINLAAYHLPLDAHGELGNNIQLAKRLHLNVKQKLMVDKNPNLFYIGELVTPLSANELASKIQSALNRQAFVEIVHNRPIKKLAWCTGGAQDYISFAIAQDCDAYITGEVSERTIHIAREAQINFFAAGHHATERYGIQALGEHLAEKFNLTHHYVDIENPI